MKTWQYHVEEAERVLDMGARSLAPAMESCAKLAEVHLQVATLLLAIETEVLP